MRRLTALTLALGLLLPSAALADDDAEEASSRHAWGTFFSQSGAAMGATGLVGVFGSVDWAPTEDELPALLMIPGLSGAGAALGYAAGEGRWSPQLGWALSGIYPGALTGAALGVSAMILEGQMSDGVALSRAVGLSILGGALAGSLGLLAESLDAGHPGALIGGYYGGFGTGLAAGLFAMSFSDDPAAQAAPFLASAVGGLLGVVVTEAVRQATR